MKIALILVGVCLTSALSLAQLTKDHASIKSKDIPLVPCAEFGDAASCSTFNQMLAAHDDALRNLQLKDSQTYVCFVNGYDLFFTFQFGILPEHQLHVAPSGTIQRGVVLNTYLKGQSNSQYVGPIIWKWIKDDPSSANANLIESNLANLFNSVNIDTTQISLIYSYENMDHATVTANTTIRRSTGRFETQYVLSNHSKMRDDEGKCVIYPR
jgi:hypothetical protein